jgi:2-keto-4-pentenoate hydratase/2-oxohepta-3-ene-1,7-dioic acid hydratase in catechol pathway
MRLARFAVDGSARLGLVRDDRIVPLADSISLEGILGGAAEDSSFVPTERASVALSGVRLLAPVIDHPRGLFAVGWNYREHFAEGAAARGKDVAEPTVPTFFLKASTTIIGPQDDISIDDQVSEMFDYEAELGVVIGRRGRSVKASDAMAHVFGYVLANDVTARDVQKRHGGQWFKGKSLDATCPIGPWIVTADEVGDPGGLTIESEVNGEARQHASTSAMAFSIQRLIEDLSAGLTLLPGDILLTGTPEGVGQSRQPPVFLRDGDVVTTRISGIGEMRNRVSQVAKIREEAHDAAGSAGASRGR